MVTAQEVEKSVNDGLQEHETCIRIKEKDGLFYIICEDPFIPDSGLLITDSCQKTLAYLVRKSVGIFTNYTMRWGIDFMSKTQYFSICLKQNNIFETIKE